MNLKVSNSVTTKTYALTNAAPAKPYLNVSNSFLPLTTNTTSGLKLKVTKNNNTYRALEYGTVSSSDTFYTSANVSDGLSSTTGLTRASTSGTTYLTRASTSDTKYGTRASTSGTTYLTRASTSDIKYGTRVSTSGTTYLTRASTSGTTYLTRASTSGTTYYTRASTSATQTITEYTSSSKSTLELTELYVTHVGTRSNADYKSTNAASNNGYGYTYDYSLMTGISFNVNDIRNNNFQKITYSSRISYRASTSGKLNDAYTVIYTSGSTRIAQLNAGNSTSILYTSGVKNIPTAYPNLTSTKWFPWDSGPFAGTLGAILNRKYYTTKIGNTVYGSAVPLLSVSVSTTAITGNSSYVRMTGLRYVEILNPTTRAIYSTRASTSNTVYGTRASTSNTVYGTRASTSNTVYGTRASTSGTTYYTRVSTSGTNYGTRASTSDTTYLTRVSTSETNYGTRASTSGYSGVSSSSISTTSWI